ncbi:SUF system NifU family Fe-S cluster assembly protein [bacterium]|nr:SUF system NifU family Fe-S cluster assembly protein [bacterium]
MSDLRDLYQELVLDHGQHPRNHRPMHDCDHEKGCLHREGYNPLCGDKLTLYVKKAADGTLEDLCFEGSGCAIFTASSSMLTEVLKGRRTEEVRAILDEFLGMLTSGEKTPDPDGLGKLAVFGGVKDFPARVKCATLPWRALEAILASQGDQATGPDGAVDSNDDEVG